MEQIAIVHGIDFGNRDAGQPILYFDVKFLDGGALLIFGKEEAFRIVKESGCYGIRDLEGKPCVIDYDPSKGIVTFNRWFK